MTPGIQRIPEIDESKCLKFLSEFIKIPSHSKSAAEIDAIEYMTKAMLDIGLEAQSFPFIDKDDGMQRANSVGVWRGTGVLPDKKTLLFNGHVDVNPVTEGWTVDPVGGVYDKDFIYGIGVSNMKSGCCAYYMAVYLLKKAGFKVSKDCTLTFVVGELQGGSGTVALIEQGKITKDVDFFVNCEPTDIKGLTMHAGSAIVKINVIGDTRHMSKREELTDAILLSMDIINNLTYLTFSSALTETHELVNRCHIGTIRAGLGRNYEEWRQPQVADFSTIQLAARFAPGQNEHIVLEDIKRELKKTKLKYPKLEFEVELVKRDFMPPFEVDPNSDIVTTMNKHFLAVRNYPQPTGVLKPPCFYGSDAGHMYEKLQLQGIVMGPGGKYNTMPDEKVDLVDYFDCIRIFMRLIVDMCGGYIDD